MSDETAAERDLRLILDTLTALAEQITRIEALIEKIALGLGVRPR